MAPSTRDHRAQAERSRMTRANGNGTRLASVNRRSERLSRIASPHALDRGASPRTARQAIDPAFRRSIQGSPTPSAGRTARPSSCAAHPAGRVPRQPRVSAPPRAASAVNADGRRSNAIPAHHDQCDQPPPVCPTSTEHAPDARQNSPSTAPPSHPSPWPPPPYVDLPIVPCGSHSCLDRAPPPRRPEPARAERHCSRVKRSNAATTPGQSTAAVRSGGPAHLGRDTAGRRRERRRASTKAHASPGRQHLIAMSDVNAGRRVVVRHDDQAARHRLERDIPERLRLAREQEDVGRSVVGGEVRARAHPAEYEVGLRLLERRAVVRRRRSRTAPRSAPAASPGRPPPPAGRSSPRRPPDVERHEVLLPRPRPPRGRPSAAPDRRVAVHAATEHVDVVEADTEQPASQLRAGHQGAPRPVVQPSADSIPGPRARPSPACSGPRSPRSSYESH
jgi:hypothetical protein